MTSETHGRTAPHFPKLFEPGMVAGMSIKNRIVLLPMGTFPSFSDELFAFYRERAKGGAAVLMMNRAKVSPIGLGGRGLESVARSAIWDDTNADGWKRLAETIKSNGARAVLQIDHDGIEAGTGIPSGVQPVGPSAVSVPRHPLFRPNPPVARALSTQEVRDFVDYYVEAADRAKKYGWDGVQVYAGQGVLPMQFLSSRTNLREDGYGGNLENRLRFLLEILGGIKETCGRDYPLFVRLVADEGLEAGVTPEEGVQIAVALDQVGDADAVDLCYGTHTSPVPMALPPPCFPEGALLGYADQVRPLVRHMQLIAMGGIYTPEAAERFLEEGRGYLIGLGRALIADPYWPLKAMEGRPEDIITCIGCLKCFEAGEGERTGRWCSTNPIFGRESKISYDLKPATVKKRVLVVGGGPGGMQAAALAARRGHQVQLWEAGNELGGDLMPGAVPPHKSRITDYRNYLTTQLREAAVQVKLGQRATAEAIVREHPDAVVVATGGQRRLLDIPGMQHNHVIHAIDLLLGVASVKGRKAAIIGGGGVGLETAEYLAADKGMEVVVIEMLPRMAAELHPYLRKWLQDRLRGGDCDPQGLGVRLLTNATCEEITEQGVWITHKDTGKRELIEADTVVIAVGQVSNTELGEALRGKVSEVYPLGNCADPSGRIFEVSREALELGLKI